ncbi:MAG TPA: outer membrane protein assembly factor BamD [Nitrospiraceae bacterium]|nr:outer membrane protein assembly factor BamD [Nitrospiraceae bacterium]
MQSQSRVLCVCVGLAVSLWMTSGCSSKSKTASGKPVSGTDEQIFLGDTIEKNYDPNVIMKRGEAFFEKEEFAEAIVEFQHFLELHRSHQLASYAQFRLGESHLKMAKSIDRDPDPVQKAIGAFEKLRREFPGSKYEAQAQQRIDECHDWLAQTHLFVGQFYYRRASYLAAAHRFDQVMKDYADKKVAPDALYYLALSYKEMGADDWAAEKLTLLAEKYPESDVARDGEKLLAKLQKTAPAVSAAVAKKEEPDVDGTADTNLLASIASPSLPAPSTRSAAAALPGTPSLSIRQPFVSCRLGSWC